MPATLVEQVLAALAQRLATWPGLTGIAVERARIAEIGCTPALVVSAGPVSSEDIWTHRTDVTIAATVEAWHAGERAHGEATVEARLLELAGFIQAAIDSDPTFGGLADDTEVAEVSHELAGGDPPEGSIAVSLRIATGHARGNPFTRA